MENTKFTDKELKYINANIYDRNSCAYVIQIDLRGRENVLVAKLPVGIYKLELTSRKEREDVISQLASYRIPYMLVKNGIDFGINSSMEYQNLGLSLVKLSSNVIALRKQAIINKRNLLKNQDDASISTIK